METTTVKIRYAAGFSAKVKAEEAHAALEMVRETNGGVLRPSDVVDAARPDDAPLHPAFTWDDADAAEKYRQDEARRLIRSVCVIDTSKPEALPQPVYLHVKADNRGQQYLTTTEVMSNDEHRTRVLEQAMSQLRGWRKKYNELVALSPIFAAADEVEETIGSKEG